MQKALTPANEAERLKALERLGILDTKAEERFDSITREACAKLQVPISIISLIDKNREWYKSCQGLNVKEGPRDISFCGHAMLSKMIFIVEDALKDYRFADNPMVINPPYIRFYAGVALLEAQTRLPIGVLCVKDVKPRQMSIEEINTLIDLGKKAEAELNKKNA